MAVNDIFFWYLNYFLLGGNIITAHFDFVDLQSNPNMQVAPSYNQSYSKLFLILSKNNNTKTVKGRQQHVKKDLKPRLLTIFFADNLLNCCTVHRAGKWLCILMSLIHSGRKYYCMVEISILAMFGKSSSKYSIRQKLFPKLTTISTRKTQDNLQINIQKITQIRKS